MGKQKKLNSEVLIIRKDNGKEEIALNFEKLQRAALILRSVNHPLRKTILEMLHAKREMIVTDIYTMLKTEQSVISQHLKILRMAEMVTTIRRGKFIFYSLNKKRIAKVVTVVDELAQ